MNPDMPPTGPTPSDSPPPPLEVRAEPARADDRTHSIPMQPLPSAPPPPPPPAAPPPVQPQAAPPPPQSPPPYVHPTPQAQPKNHAWAMACHLVGLLDLGVSFLLFGVIATTAVWLIKKDEDAQVDFHGKEALNFQLNVLFWQLAAIPLALCLIGIPLGFALPFAKVILMLIAALRAANGERWTYPLTYRLIR